MMTAPRCGGHSGLGSGVSSGSRGSLGSGSGLLMAAPPCHQVTPEPAGASSGNNGVTILPVTAENLAKLDNSRDIDLSFPITSTYLRQMRHRPMEVTSAAVGAEADEDDDEVGYNILYQTKSDRNRTLTSGSEYWRTSHWPEPESEVGIVLNREHLLRPAVRHDAKPTTIVQTS